MTNAFLVELRPVGEHTFGTTFSTFVEAGALFRQSLSQGIKARLYALSLKQKPILICDTDFYKPKER